MVDIEARRYPKDNLGRRIRGRRTPSGKRIVLQLRDIEILKLLRRYRFLRSTFLWQLLPPEHRGQSFKRFQDRLTDLFHETDTPHGGAYLDWPRQQRDAYNARYAPSVYALSEAGENLLKEERIAPDNLTDLIVKGRMVVNQEFAHAMMICDTLASIEIGTRSTPGIRLVAWPEIMTKAPLETWRLDNPFAIPVTISHRFPRTTSPVRETFRLIPDGLFGLEYSSLGNTRRYRFFALEAERRNRVNTGSLKGTSFLKKVLAYRAIIDKGIHEAHWGIPNLMVMTVAPTLARIETMKRVVLDVCGPAGSALFLFRCVAAQGYGDRVEPATGNMLLEPWERAGLSAFLLGNAVARE